MSDQKTDLQKLLKLKQFETPGEEYFDGFSANLDPQPSNVIAGNFGPFIKIAVPVAAAAAVIVFAAPKVLDNNREVSASVMESAPQNVELHLNGSLEKSEQKDKPTKQLPTGVLPAGFGK
ncbi:MAG: hypothetical protein AAF226_15380 [Verrucomicrobiota bacterium]